MKQVELYAKVRYAVQVEGLSERGAARRFGIDPRTVGKMMEFSVPPGYRRSRPPARPKLGAYIAVIDNILADDKRRPRSNSTRRSGFLNGFATSTASRAASRL